MKRRHRKPTVAMLSGMRNQRAQTNHRAQTSYTNHTAQTSSASKGRRDSLKVPPQEATPFIV